MPVKKSGKKTQTVANKSTRFSQLITGNQLNLSRQELTDKDIPDIMRFLHSTPSIKSLDLSMNNIGDQGLADFVERNQTINHLNFAGNLISDRGLAFFAYKNIHIIEVNFSHNLISDKGIGVFAELNITCNSSQFSIIQYH